MPTQNADVIAKGELLNKTADFYRRSIADYSGFVKTERNKPRTKKQLETRLKAILLEIEALGTTSVV
jgi:hypothetical protein